MRSIWQRWETGKIYSPAPAMWTSTPNRPPPMISRLPHWKMKPLVPISGDIAPMVYVNDTLYQIVDSQPNFADEKSSFNLLGKIESTVS